jgi:hypothetical protein
MSLNVGDQECNSGKKYRQKGTLCGPNRNKNNTRVSNPTRHIEILEVVTNLVC